MLKGTISIVNKKKRHSKQKEAAIINLTSEFESHFLVSFDNEEGKKVSNLRDFYLEGMPVDIKQKYSMFYIYSLVRFLSNLLSNLDKEYSPFVSEYFAIFRIKKDAYVKSRKTWNPYES